MAKQLKDKPTPVEIPKSEVKAAAAVRASKLQFDESRYEYDDSFIPSKLDSIYDVHTVAEMKAYLEKHPETLIEAKVLHASKGGKWTTKKLERKGFLESYNQSNKKIKFKEDFANFDTQDYSAGLVGNDFISLIGGPFNKQLYPFDYIRQIGLAFYAINHDPFARAIVNITRDFTLGRGFRVDSDNDGALALWRAFEEANDLQAQMESCAVELSAYGETMWWWLPNNETKIAYRLSKGQTVPQGIIPRVRLTDPSNIWDITTYPEDVTRVLCYNWVAPTQWQTYSSFKGENVPTAKFIFQQIPASQMLHFKINAVSNEKRGRSDLFPVMGYMKRLRDSVNYAIIAMQKNAAWSLDTTINGSDEDIAAYIAQQQNMAEAGSEFVHNKQIERKYMANEGAGRGSPFSFEWCASMIAVGSQIPLSYFATHLTNSGTRASALVATEPVAKKFQQRQLVYERIIKALWKKLMQEFGMDADCEVTFPEIIVQDRTAKIQDLVIAQQSGYLSKERVANMIAKEFNITNFDYSLEKKEIEKEPLTQMAPLSMPEQLGDEEKEEPSSAITSKDREEATDDDRSF